MHRYTSARVCADQRPLSGVPSHCPPWGSKASCLRCIFQTGWLVNFQAMLLSPRPISPSECQNYRRLPLYGCLCGFWGSNLGHQACTAGVLPAEPSPWPVCLFFIIIIINHPGITLNLEGLEACSCYS